jgi:hypothetical protein
VVEAPGLASQAPPVVEAPPPAVAAAPEHDALAVARDVIAGPIPSEASAIEASNGSAGAEPMPAEAPIDRTDAILAASNGSWIEAIAPFVPETGATDSSSAAAEQMRRRRRRGGRRGGRGRRLGVGTSEQREDSLSPVPDAAPARAASDPESQAAPTGEAPRLASRRRRRRGGSGRRRMGHDGRTSSDGANGTATVAVTAPAEPPADS